MKPNLLFLPLIVPLSTHAQITTDGTLGQALNLPGPDYQIGADLGQLRGGNLFHSFQDFNLQGFETATFYGPNHIQNVISRVTGGNPSRIDGLFRSIIPNADMYFLNPYGIMFGPNAKLDVQGSFHASTADYLRLGEGGRFDARNPSDNLLTVAPVEAFGFLTDNSAPITTQDSDLSVLKNQTLSLIGGEIDLSGHSPVKFDERGFMAVFARSKLSAPAGRINLASIASKGEVIPSETDLDFNADGGKIKASNTLMDVSGRGSGRVFIRGGQFVMDAAAIQANTLADQDGQGIDITLTQGLKISGNLLAISSNTFSKGRAGHLIITTPFLEISESFIYAATWGEGQAGNITFQADTINLLAGSLIATDSYASGSGGEITITTTGQFLISDQRLFLKKEDAKFGTSITATSTSSGNGGQLTINAKQLILDGGAISSNTHQTGNAGKIIIKTEQLQMTTGGLISATAFSQATGTSGNIEINTETLQMSGFRPGFTRTTTDFFENVQSSIGAITFGKGSAGNISILAKNIHLENDASIAAATVGDGTAGQMIIEVENLSLNSGGFITTSSGGIIGGTTYLGTGTSGTLKIIASGNIIISGRSDFTTSGLLSNTLVSGEGGNIEVQANHLTLTEGAIISANSLGTGKAGNITIQANTINLTDNGTITTSAAHATGGNMIFVIPNRLLLREGQITTSVHGGTGDGGNITISAPTFVVLDKSQIKAQADAGHGGNIRIAASQFIKSYESFVTAPSRLGLDGDVEIDSLNKNIAEGMLTLSSEMVDASRMIEKTCEAMTYQERKNRSHFVVQPLAGNPASPYDLQPSPLPKTTLTKQHQQSSRKITHQSSLMVATTCKLSPTQIKTPVKKQERIIPEQLF